MSASSSGWGDNWGTDWGSTFVYPEFGQDFFEDFVKRMFEQTVSEIGQYLMQLLVNTIQDSEMIDVFISLVDSIAFFMVNCPNLIS